MVENIVPKVESTGKHVFQTYILPLGAFAVGLFSARMFFGWAAQSLAEVVSEASTTGGLSIDISTMFGSTRNGVLILLALILAGVGFWLYRDGMMMKTAALFVLGSALGTAWAGFKNATWSG